ncbi:MAG: hypothetical protein BM561_01350 [Vibrio sp. MedPE-SWchi]|nr:MAG: hypothetical protein BM561_01350 [Vibrio sp. MedPE-SWchi]
MSVSLLLYEVFSGRHGTLSHQSSTNTHATNDQHAMNEAAKHAEESAHDDVVSHDDEDNHETRKHDDHKHDSSDQHKQDHHSDDEVQNGLGKTELMISPLPSEYDIDKPLAKIGWLLFKDPGLSSNGLVSCESCHNLRTNGAEDIDISVGVGGRGTRNSLTVFNTTFNYRFFWDARANSLAEQIDGPVHNVLEMDSNWEHIVAYVSQSPLYINRFKSANLTIEEASIKQALVAFMGGLITANSRFDLYLNGDETALSQQEKVGWKKFQEIGCINCHRGTNIGGGMVMEFGFFLSDEENQDKGGDTGRHLITSDNKDMNLFRVASLRNVADTAPYFHDGRTNSLREAIRVMGKYQLGQNFDDQTVEELHAFLTTLSGERPEILAEFSNE